MMVYFGDVQLVVVDIIQSGLSSSILHHIVFSPPSKQPMSSQGSTGNARSFHVEISHYLTIVIYETILKNHF